jgi:hypothetical protein
MIGQHTQEKPVQSVNDQTREIEYVDPPDKKYNASAVLSIDTLIKRRKLTE